MKRYGTSAVLALMFGGAAAVIAGCPGDGDTFKTPAFELEGAGGAGGEAGAGASGGSGGALPNPLCGNGIVDVDAGEACDDGSRKDGDGCSADCSNVEECWECPNGIECEALAKNSPCRGDDAHVCNGNGECLLVNGQPCNDFAQCLSGFCADGVCCAVSCEGTCKSCNIPGNVGNCTEPKDVPIGWSDDSCDGTTACGLDANMMGECQEGRALGEPCLEPPACINENCKGGYCRLPPNEPCNDSVQCDTNYCNGDGKCDEPQNDTADCISDQISNNKCKAAAGEPCDSTGAVSCTSDFTCLDGICRAKVGTECTANYKCESNFCSIVAGQLIGVCASCPAGTTCVDAFPTGAYCHDNADCASGKCTGFPQKCQP